jgi:hypothetical protein
METRLNKFRDEESVKDLVQKIVNDYGSAFVYTDNEGNMSVLTPSEIKVYSKPVYNPIEPPVTCTRNQLFDARGRKLANLPDHRRDIEQLSQELVSLINKALYNDQE